MTEIIGQDIGGYRILEQIGQGGMARVFKAYQPAMDRVVALKVLPDLYAQDETARARFLQEAQIIASLEHPHILPVYDFGEEEETAFLVMRYLQAGNLKSLLAAAPEGKLSLSDAALLTTQIASALDHAHQQGIIHRDVKPSNILIDSQGQAFLTDFGIAKVLEATSHLTKTGSTLGTPAYMSPEQAAGKDLDGRSDVYSLGIILYQMLTGSPPFEADTPYATIIAQINDPLPLPTSINPKIPQEAEQILLKALAKDPEERYQTANELTEALANISGEQHSSEKVSSPLLDISHKLAEANPGETLTPSDQRLLKQITKTRRRKGLVPWLVGGVFVLALAAAGGLIFRASQQSSQGQTQSTQNSQTSHSQSTPSALALESITSPTPDNTITPTPLPTLEPIFTNPYLGPAPEGAIARLGKGTIEQIDLSPDDKTLAIGGSLGVWLLDLDTNEFTSYLEYYGKINSLMWSPSGDKIAAGLENGFVILWDTRSGKQLFTLSKHTGQVYDLDWSPDGITLASSSEDGLVILWDAESGNYQQTFQGDSGPVRSISWSPDGEIIATAVTNNVLIWDVDSGEIESILHNKHLTSDITIGDLSWSPEGDLLVVGGWTGISLYDRLSSELIWENLTIQKVKEIAWADDEETISVVMDTGEIQLVQANNGNIVPLDPVIPFLVTSAVWSDAGSSMVLGYTDGSLVFWKELSSFSQINTIKTFSTGISSLAWSPNGLSLATGDMSGSVTIWDSENLKPIQQPAVACDIEYDTGIQKTPTAIEYLTWSYDGERLATISCEAVQLWGTEHWNYFQSAGYIYPNAALRFSPTSYLLPASRSGCDNTGTCSSSYWFVDGYYGDAGSFSGNFEQYNVFNFHQRWGNNLAEVRLNEIAFSPDGTYLATSSSKNIFITKSFLFANNINILEYNLDQRLQEISWEDSLHPIALVWSPDGKWLAGASNEIKIWDPYSGDLQRVLDGHTDPINSLDWSPSGEFIASGSNDKTIILWDPEFGEALYILEGHHAPITNIAFSPDGKYLASGSEDGTIILWDNTKLEK